MTPHEASVQLMIDEVRLLRSELRQHVKDETHDFTDIRRSIHEINTKVEVNKSRLAGAMALVSAAVAGAVSYAGRAFGHW